MARLPARRGRRHEGGTDRHDGRSHTPETRPPGAKGLLDHETVVEDRRCGRLRGTTQLPGLRDALVKERCYHGGGLVGTVGFGHEALESIQGGSGVGVAPHLQQRSQ